MISKSTILVLDDIQAKPSLEDDAIFDLRPKGPGRQAISVRVA